MDRRQVELQIRAVVVAFRIERRRQETSTMDGFRARAHAILDAIEDEARQYPDLEARLVETRDELDAG